MSGRNTSAGKGSSRIGLSMKRAHSAGRRIDGPVFTLVPFLVQRGSTAGRSGGKGRPRVCDLINACQPFTCPMKPEDLEMKTTNHTGANKQRLRCPWPPYKVELAKKKEKRAVGALRNSLIRLDLGEGNPRIFFAGIWPGFAGRGPDLAQFGFRSRFSFRNLDLPPRMDFLYLTGAGYQSCLIAGSRRQLRRRDASEKARPHSGAKQA